MENETTIPELPAGTSIEEMARTAYRVAWSASNAAAGYHASIINHLVAHEKRTATGLATEFRQMRAQLSEDFVKFQSTLIASLQAVGIRIDLSPSGEHSRVAIVDTDPGRERVASSHDLEEVGERIEEQLDERLRDLTRDLKGPAPIPSDRVRAMLSEERATIEAKFESEQRFMRLDLEKKQAELAHATEVKRLTDQRTDLVEANARWWRVAFMVAGGLITVLAGLLFWAITKQSPSIATP